MRRILEPELLDSLAPCDPNAVHSRRDLRLTNQIMGNHRWLTRTLRRLLHKGEAALELGAGTGELGQQLAAHGVAADGIDHSPRPENWPRDRAWHVGDLRTFGDYDRYPVIFGNLIFHHFNDRELSALGEIFRRRVRAIVACEPARRPVYQKIFVTLAPLFRANHVTLHDAPVSIAAGFVGEELPAALGLSASDWDCRCTTTLRGAYHMIAIRHR
jgi:hypothetical protein